MSVSVVVGTLTGPLGRLSAARLAVVPAAPGSGAHLSQAVCQRQANLRWPRRIVGVEVGEEGVPTRPCHGDRDPPQSRSPATSTPTYAEDPTDRVIRRRTLRVIPNPTREADTGGGSGRPYDRLPACGHGGALRQRGRGHRVLLPQAGSRSRPGPPLARGYRLRTPRSGPSRPRSGAHRRRSWSAGRYARRGTDDRLGPGLAGITAPDGVHTLIDS
jgi:hypothetical protein